MYGEPVRAGDIDDVAVVWSYRGQRRAIVDAPWPLPRLIVDHLLKHFAGAVGHRQAVAMQLGRLCSAGDPVALRLRGEHRIALVRSDRAAGDMTAGPVLLALGDLRGPVVFGDIERARGFARREQARRGERLPWVLYPAERAVAPEAFLPRLSTMSRWSARTELEEALLATLNRRPRSRERKAA